MVQNQGRGARISGIGYYVPELVLSNFDLEKIVDTSDEWIVTRSGIRERRIAADDQASSDLAIEASKRALDDARVKAEDIDIIIVGTVTPDMPFPSTACIIQDKLGAHSSSAFDVTAACSGFIYGVTVAEAMIATGKVERALVVGVTRSPVVARLPRQVATGMARQRMGIRKHD